MINIESCKVNNEGASAFADTGALETLCIRLNSVSDIAVKSYAAYLPLRKLGVLNLKGNKVTDTGVLSLCEVLGACRHLRLLNLRNNAVTCNGALALAEAIKSSSCGLKVLRLRSNRIRDVGVHALAGVLEKLDELDLDMNKLTDSGKAALKSAVALAQAIGLNPVVYPVPAGQISFPRTTSAEEQREEFWCTNPSCTAP